MASGGTAPHNHRQANVVGGHGDRRPGVLRPVDGAGHHRGGPSRRIPSGPPRRRPRSSRSPRHLPRPPMSSPSASMQTQASGTPWPAAAAIPSGPTCRPRVTSRCWPRTRQYRPAPPRRPAHHRSQHDLADGDRRVRLGQSERPGAAHRSRSKPRQQFSECQLDRAGERRQPHHELHGHSVHRQCSAADNGGDRHSACHDSGGRRSDRTERPTRSRSPRPTPSGPARRRQPPV